MGTAPHDPSVNIWMFPPSALHFPQQSNTGATMQRLPAELQPTCYSSAPWPPIPRTVTETGEC